MSDFEKKKHIGKKCADWGLSIIIVYLLMFLDIYIIKIQYEDDISLDFVTMNHYSIDSLKWRHYTILLEKLIKKKCKTVHNCPEIRIEKFSVKYWILLHSYFTQYNGIMINVT